MFTPPPTRPPAMRLPSDHHSNYGSPPYPPAGPVRLDAVMAATDGPVWGSVYDLCGYSALYSL